MSVAPSISLTLVVLRPKGLRQPRCAKHFCRARPPPPPIALGVWVHLLSRFANIAEVEEASEGDALSRMSVSDRMSVASELDSDTVVTSASRRRRPQLRMAHLSLIRKNRVREDTFSNQGFALVRLGGIGLSSVLGDSVPLACTGLCCQRLPVCTCVLLCLCIAVVPGASSSVVLHPGQDPQGSQVPGPASHVPPHCQPRALH